ncbi:uncharacterized protein LOC119733834 [Patiria miniata]|uniref:PHD-type domain-containing protein n=1 Tax=Patiria miniata TaxID=46514 RepID=A0A914AHW5_PATMI|nr:uncharacterized protein LOC119733834 [Patiria miniata]
MRRNGKRIELWMSEDQRQVHDRIQKNMYCRTRRSLEFVIKKMDNMSELQNRKRKHSKHASDVTRVNKNVRCSSAPRTVQKGKEMSAQCNKVIGKIEQSEARNSKNSEACEKSLEKLSKIHNKQCWWCDQSIKSFETHVQCDSCDIWYHVKCMNFSKMDQLLTNKAVARMCRKCGRSSFSKSLLYDLGIPTDINTFELTHKEDEADKDALVDRMDADDSIEDEQMNNVNGVSGLKMKICSARIGQGTGLRKIHVTEGTGLIIKQTGGYSLRKRKGQSSNDQDGRKRERDKIVETRSAMCTRSKKVVGSVSKGIDSDEKKCQEGNVQKDQAVALEIKQSKTYELRSRKRQALCASGSCETKSGAKKMKSKTDDKSIGMCTKKPGVLHQTRKSMKWKCEEVPISDVTELGNNMQNRTDTNCRVLAERTVQGNFHQGDLRFGFNSGKQCVANSLCAILYSRTKLLKDCDWENPLSEVEDTEENEDDVRKEVGDKSDDSDDEQGGGDDEETDDDRLRGMALDSCLQPIDIGQEVLDQYFNDVLCVAPCEGNSPIRILMEQGTR